MKIRSVIIDDEPLARKGLKEYIADVDFLQFEAEFESPVRALDKLNKDTIDLIFLDIQMPKITGIEFLRSLTHPPLVIITTAYPQYALEGFELDVLDYLVKPISFPRFMKAAMKAKDRLTMREAVQSGPAAGEDHFYIKSEGALVRVLFNDILLVEATQNYVTIHTTNKKHLSHLTFKSVEESLPAKLFLKVHKSFIVNLSKIEGIGEGGLLIGPHRIPVSRTNREEIMEMILRGKLLKR